MTYQPLKFFLLVGSVPFTAGFLIGVRWLVLYLEGTPRTHVPSLILASLLMLIGVQLGVLGLVADLLGVNRKMLEDIQLRVRRSEFDASKEQPYYSAGYSRIGTVDKK